MGAENWLLFKSAKEARRCEEYLVPTQFDITVLDENGNYLHDCWLGFRSPMKLEIGYSFGGGLMSECADIVQREICQRFDVRRIGADSVGWYAESDWQSTHPEGAPSRYGPYPSWAAWAKDWKPEWSHALPKSRWIQADEGYYNQVLANVRRIDACVTQVFKELDAKWTSRNNASS